MIYEICNDDRTVASYNIDVPAWIDQDITAQDLAAICQGGCASGAYMPAVTYAWAAQTMFTHGDDVLECIIDVMGELPTPRNDISWSEMAVHYLSYAVELWAHEAHDRVEDIASVEAAEDYQDELKREFYSCGEA